MGEFSIEVDICHADGAWPEASSKIIEVAIFRAIDELELSIAGPAELSILLTNDAQQRELNQQWRQIDKSTNVLSFPQIEPFGVISGLLGDISLAFETVEREARDLDKSFQNHLTHLAIHGFLHIVGYDHINDADATKMETLETVILSTLGISDPYNLPAA